MISSTARVCRSIAAGAAPAAVRIAPRMMGYLRARESHHGLSRMVEEADVYICTSREALRHRASVDPSPRWNTIAQSKLDKPRLNFFDHHDHGKRYA
jgi:hypothetical protein